MNRPLITIAALLIFPLSVLAMPGAGGPGSQEFHARKLERLTQELNLTPEQKPKVEAIFKEQHEKFKALHDETQSKLGTVLTPEQMKKMDELKQQRRDHWKRKNGKGPQAK